MMSQMIFTSIPKYSRISISLRPAIFFHSTSGCRCLMVSGKFFVASPYDLKVAHNGIKGLGIVFKPFKGDSCGIIPDLAR